MEVFKQREKIVCGFESGVLRVFCIKSYQIQGELSFHKSRITSISINGTDEMGISADQSGVVCLFNAELQHIKTIETDR